MNDADDEWAKDVFGARGGDADDALRERVFRMTGDVIAKRRRGLWVRRTAAAILLFGAGVGAGMAFDRRGASDPRPKTAEDVVARAPERSPAPVAIDDDPTALELRAAEGAIAERAALLRRAGDLYLTAHRDLESAMRCYRDFLNLTRVSPESRPGGDDTWLLAALRNEKE